MKSGTYSHFQFQNNYNELMKSQCIVSVINMVKILCARVFPPLHEEVVSSDVEQWVLNLAKFDARKICETL